MMKFRLFAVLLALCVAIPAMAQNDPPPHPIYQVVDDLEGWLAGISKVPVANISEEVRTEVRNAFHGLRRLSDAKEMVVLDGTDSVKRGFWLLRADADGYQLADALAVALDAPQTTASRKHLQKLALCAARLQAVLGELRSVASYAHVEVREVPKEVVRTVEVPVPCPAPEPPPQPRESPCTAALRQGADRWSSQLYKWTDRYRGIGADWALADSSKAELRRIAMGSGDPAAYVVGWLAQWRSIRRKDDTSVLGSGPLPQIAADMRAQLQLCGQLLPDQDR